MGSRRWLRGQSDAMVSLSAPGPLTTLGTSRSTGAFEEVRRVYEDFATALGAQASGHLLLDLHHADVAFGLVVVERDPRVGGEAQIGIEASAQAAGQGAVPAAD